MNIKGHAFTEDEKETSERRRKRYAELSHLRKDMIADDQRHYGKNVFSGPLPKGVDLSDEDIAIICDEGNCCFGGSVVRGPSTFTCTIWID